MDLQHIRNLGISAHIDSGKTTLSERILFYSGRIHKMEEVKGDGDGATMDFMDLEKERGITITSAATQVTWGATKVDGSKEDYTINLIDTPGHVDFTVEVERSLRVLDGAILVLCSVGGVQSQSLTVDRQMKRYKVPRIGFVNKMDRTGANFFSVVKQVRDKLHVTPVVLQIPIGSGPNFEGVIDLIQMRAIYNEGKKGMDVVIKPIPADYLDQAQEYRAAMLEALSMYDDELMSSILEETEFPAEKLVPIIRKATLSHEITPMMCGSAFKDKGVQSLLDAVAAYLPSPIDRTVTAIDNDATAAARKSGEIKADEFKRITLTPDPTKPAIGMAFKTVVEQFGQLTYTRLYQGTLKKGETYTNTRTGKSVRFGRLVRLHADERQDIDIAEAGDIIAVVGVDCATGDTFVGSGLEDVSLESIFAAEPVIRLSIEPANRDNASNLSKALERFRREDPTFHVMSDPETGETLIAGMGQLHLEIYVERIKREYKCETKVGQPKVAYKETPQKTVEFNYKHKKQTGGSGQYAHVVGKIFPLPEDNTKNYEFFNKITQGKIPGQFIPAIDFGFQRALVKGPLCECEVVRVGAEITDGSYHDVDSSERAFETCAWHIMRDNLMLSDMCLLEPIMKLEIEVPEEYQGPVTGHLSSKRGVIGQTGTNLGVAVINAEVPLANMFDYANELRSMTQGKGGFSMEFASYQKVPKNIQAEVVERSRKEKAEKAKG